MTPDNRSTDDPLARRTRERRARELETEINRLHARALRYGFTDGAHALKLASEKVAGAPDPA